VQYCTSPVPYRVPHAPAGPGFSCPGLEKTHPFPAMPCPSGPQSSCVVDRVPPNDGTKRASLEPLTPPSFHAQAGRQGTATVYAVDEMDNTPDVHVPFFFVQPKANSSWSTCQKASALAGRAWR
jgi:hypothetical protein